MPHFDCLRCGTAMQFVGQHKLQLGKTSWLFGDLPNLMAGALDVSIMACPACGKLEFFTVGIRIWLPVSWRVPSTSARTAIQN